MEKLSFNGDPIYIAILAMQSFSGNDTFKEFRCDGQEKEFMKSKLLNVFYDMDIDTMNYHLQEFFKDSTDSVLLTPDNLKRVYNKLKIDTYNSRYFKETVIDKLGTLRLSYVYDTKSNILVPARFGCHSDGIVEIVEEVFERDTSNYGECDDIIRDMDNYIMENIVIVGSAGGEDYTKSNTYINKRAVFVKQMDQYKSNITNEEK